MAASAIRDTHFCVVILCDVDLFRPNSLSINQVSALFFFCFFFSHTEKKIYCDLILINVKLLWSKPVVYNLGRVGIMHMFLSLFEKSCLLLTTSHLAMTGNKISFTKCHFILPCWHRLCRSSLPSPSVCYSSSFTLINQQPSLG